jgi:excisionase family DNA binding protein
VKLSAFTSVNKLIGEKSGGRIPRGFYYLLYPVLYPVCLEVELKPDLLCPRNEVALISNIRHFVNMRNAVSDLAALGLSKNEIPSFRQLQSLVQSNAHPALVGENGEQVMLPKSIYRVLVRIVRHLSAGQAVSVVPINQELTTQKAANVLGVSRPYLVRLLDAKTIPFHRVGTHRRVYLKDLLTFREKRDQKRHAALVALTKQVDKRGLYDKAYLPDENAR